jgi:hypothetical protein
VIKSSYEEVIEELKTEYDAKIALQQKSFEEEFLRLERELSSTLSSRNRYRRCATSMKCWPSWTRKISVVEHRKAQSRFDSMPDSE